jgi:dedicated sortase system histidine kinase
VRLTPRLLLISLVTLLLPWAGCQYLREVETALREGQAAALAANATSVAGALSTADSISWPDAARFSPARTPATDVYAYRLDRTPVMDGYAEDWGLPPEYFETLQATGWRVEFLAGLREGSVYLFLRVTVDPPANRPGLSDVIRLHLTDDHGQGVDLIFSTPAPGFLTPTRPDGRPERRVQANWQPGSAGSGLEIRLPASMAAQRIGFLVTHSAEGGSHRTLGTLPNLAAQPGWLIHTDAVLQETLQRSVLPGARLRVVDQRGFILGDTGPPDAPEARESSQLLRRLVRLALGGGEADENPPEVTAGRLDLGPYGEALNTGAADRRFRSERLGRALLVSARSVFASSPGVALLLAEQDTEAILSATDTAATKLLAASLLISIAAVTLLASFSAWLSWRIRRLSEAASRSLDQRGRIRSHLPEGGSPDEIGDLSRSFARLLSRLAEYNAYLQSLGEKLTHELRTPMTVVQTSLENLRADPHGDSAATYLERARTGVERLQAMMGAMGAATRIEQAIQTSEPERFDAVGVIAELAAAYADTTAETAIEIDITEDACPIEGSADLLAQMLDKLFENALDFCPQGGHIRLIARKSGSDCVIRMSNTGSRLPEGLEDRLFESMVSARSGPAGKAHLGLGLYVARLISELHSGAISARNLPDNGGVEISVRIPLSSNIAK